MSETPDSVAVWCQRARTVHGERRARASSDENAPRNCRRARVAPATGCHELGGVLFIESNMDIKFVIEELLSRSVFWPTTPSVPADDSELSAA